MKESLSAKIERLERDLEDLQNQIAYVNKLSAQHWRQHIIWHARNDGEYDLTQYVDDDDIICETEVDCGCCEIREECQHFLENGGKDDGRI